MKAAEGILTQLGGMTSHAAVVARGMGTTCVAGCGEIKVDVENEIMYYDHGQKTLKRGDIITLDGTAGEVILGTVKLAEAGSDDDFQTVLGWADKYRTLKVLTNADTPKDATNARRFGAQGIGLCRTEVRVQHKPFCCQGISDQPLHSLNLICALFLNLPQ